MAPDSPTIPPFRRKRLSVGLPIAVQAVVIIILSWFLGPRQFGDYVLAFALISILTTLTTSWVVVSQLGLASDAHTPERRAEFFTTSVLIGLLGSLLVTLLGLLIPGVAGSSGDGFMAALRCGLLSLPFLALFCSSFGALSAVGLKLSRPQIRSIAPAFGLTLGLLLLQVPGMGAGGVLIGSGLAAAVATLLLLRETAPHNLYEPAVFRWSLAWRLLKTGLPLMVPALCWLLIGCCDRFLVVLIYGPAATGVYSLAWSIADRLMILVPAVLLADFAPELSRQFRENRNESARLLGKEIARYVTLAVPVAVCLLVLGHDVFRLLLPKSYQLGVTILPWIAAGGFAAGFARYARKPLLLDGQTRRYSTLLVSAVLVNVILNLLLIPMLGLVGAGLAYVLSLVMLSTSLVGAGREVLDWRLAPSSIAVPAVSAALMAVTQLGLSRVMQVNCWTLILKMGAGLAVYFVTAALALRLLGAEMPITQAFRRGPLATIED